MTTQEEQAVIVAVEDSVIQALPESLPIAKRIDLTNRIRREVARVLRGDTLPPTA